MIKYSRYGREHGKLLKMSEFEGTTPCLTRIVELYPNKDTYYVETNINRVLKKGIDIGLWRLDSRNRAVVEIEYSPEKAFSKCIEFNNWLKSNEKR
jgi:hypothetical protein